MACAGTRFACLMALLTYVCSPGAPEGTPSKAAAAAAVHRLLTVRHKTARGSASSGHMWQLEKYEVVIFMKKVPHVLPQPSGGAGARFLRPVEVFSGYRVFSDSLIPNSMASESLTARPKLERAPGSAPLKCSASCACICARVPRTTHRKATR